MHPWRAADLLSKARRATIDVVGPSSSIETGRPFLPETSRSLRPSTASSPYRFSRTVGGNVATWTAGAVANRRWHRLRPCRAPGRAAPRRSPSPAARWRADPVGAPHGRAPFRAMRPRGAMAALPGDKSPSGWSGRARIQDPCPQVIGSQSVPHLPRSLKFPTTGRHDL